MAEILGNKQRKGKKIVKEIRETGPIRSNLQKE